MKTDNSSLFNLESSAGFEFETSVLTGFFHVDIVVDEDNDTVIIYGLTILNEDLYPGLNPFMMKFDKILCELCLFHKKGTVDASDY